MLHDDDIILTIYCAIADMLKDKDKKHSQGKLYQSEVMLCGVLFVLTGKPFRRFYHWLIKRGVFVVLPERSRLQRLVIHHAPSCNAFLGSETFFTVLDSFGVEIIHPMREGRSRQSRTICGKGKSNHRWIVGRKIAVTLNDQLEIVKCSDATDNVSDQIFDDDHALAASITLTDQGFKKKEGTPETFQICKRGQWNERMVVETLFSLWTRVCNMKRSFHRTVKGFQAKVQYLVALTNIIVGKNESLGFTRLSMVQWDL